MRERFLVVDCNVLLHYYFFTELDWPKIAEAEVIELVFPLSLISTLDRKKFESADPAVKERARKVIVRLDEISNQSSPVVRRNVTLHEFVQTTDIEYGRWGLSPNSEDDRLIADIIQYRTTYPERNIALVTVDRGMKVRSKQHHIPVVQIPDTCRLPDRPDGESKRIKELETRLARLESEKPDLKLAFVSGGNFTSINLNSPTVISLAEIEQRLQHVQQLVTRKDLADELISTMYNTSVIERAAAKVYVDEYRSYLEKANEYALSMATVIELQFVLDNVGHDSAEDTDVLIFVDGKFLVVSEEHLPNRPKQPLAPSERKREEVRSSLMGSIHIPDLPMPSNVSGPTIKRNGTRQSIGFNVKRLKQANHAVLKGAYVNFPTIAEAKSFSMSYIINSHSLPNDVEGDLHVEIKT